MNDQFWLVERGANQGQSPTCWWSGRDSFGDVWTTDVHKAHQFATKAAGEAVVQEHSISPCAVTSHGYMDASGVGGTDGS